MDAQRIEFLKADRRPPQALTKEELAERRAWTMDCMSRQVSRCCEAPYDESRVIRGGRYDGHGPYLCGKCGRLCFVV